MTNSVHSKPPRSPFAFHSIGALRNNQSMLISRKIESDSAESIGKLGDSEDGDNDGENSLSGDEENVEMNDCDGEMDLMANLDSEIVNGNAKKFDNAEDSRSDSVSCLEFFERYRKVMHRG